MIQTTSFNDKFKLVHVDRPDARDIELIQKQYNLHPILVKEIAGPSAHGKVEQHDNFLYFAIHLPTYNPRERVSRAVELDFIATSDTLLVVTYEKVEPFEEFKRTISRTDNLSHERIYELIYAILLKSVEFSLRQLKHVEEKVNLVGKRLFGDEHRKLLEEIIYVKRDLLQFSMVTVPQKALFESLYTEGASFWGPTSEIYFGNLIGEFSKVTTLLDNLKATVDSYSDTISQIFQFNTAEVMRRFSILGVLTFPLILYATIALQPKVEATFLKDATDFWILFGVITFVVILIAFTFKKKGWL